LPKLVSIENSFYKHKEKYKKSGRESNTIPNMMLTCDDDHEHQSECDITVFSCQNTFPQRTRSPNTQIKIDKVLECNTFHENKFPNMMVACAHDISVIGIQVI